MTNPNDSANPINGYCKDAGGAFCDTVIASPGLTKREYLASLAMQGLLSAPGNPSDTEFTLIVEQITLSSVAYADALIAALNKDTK